MKAGTRCAVVLGAFALVFSFAPAGASGAEMGGDPAPRDERPETGDGGDEGDDDAPRLTVKVKRSTLPAEHFSERSADIAVGGVDNPVHTADIFIECFNIPGDTPVLVDLTGGGEGKAIAKWYGDIPAVKAAVGFLGFGGHVHGGPAFEMRADSFAAMAMNEHLGRLRSSNRVESTTLRVRVPSLGITKTCTVNFVGGELKVETKDTTDYNRWQDYTVTLKIDDDPIVGHDLKVVVTEVKAIGEDGDEETLAPERDKPLKDYVHLDPKALYDHSYYQGTTTREGLKSQYRVVGNSVKSFEFRVYDFNAWE